MTMCVGIPLAPYIILQRDAFFFGYVQLTVTNTFKTT